MVQARMEWVVLVGSNDNGCQMPDDRGVSLGMHAADYLRVRRVQNES